MERNSSPKSPPAVEAEQPAVVFLDQPGLGGGFLRQGIGAIAGYVVQLLAQWQHLADQAFGVVAGGYFAVPGRGRQEGKNRGRGEPRSHGVRCQAETVRERFHVLARFPVHGSEYKPGSGASIATQVIETAAGPTFPLRAEGVACCGYP